MENDREDWIKNLKTRMEDYREPIEDGSWNLMAHRMRKSMRIRRYGLAAACVVALLGLVVGIFRLGSWSAGLPNGTTLADFPAEVSIQNKGIHMSLDDVVPKSLVAVRNRGLSTPDVAVHVIPQAPAPQTPITADTASAVTQQLPETTEPTEAAQPWESIEAQLDRQDRAQRGNKVRRYSGASGRGAQGRDWAVSVNSAVTNGMAMAFDDQLVEGVLSGVDEMSSAVNNMTESRNPIGTTSLDKLPFTSMDQWLEYATMMGNSELINALKSAAVNYEYAHHRPLSFGVSVRKGLYGNFLVETGVIATWMKSDITAYDYSSYLTQKPASYKQSTGRRDLWYLGIPLKAGWSVLNRRAATVYVTAGGTVEKCVSTRFEGVTTLVDITPHDIPLQWSVNAAIGAQWNIVPKLSLFFDPGVSYYFNDDSSISTFRKDHPFSFDVNLGFRLNL